MRQAGRYLPEYREIRATAPTFLDFCYAPAWRWKRPCSRSAVSASTRRSCSPTFSWCQTRSARSFRSRPAKARAWSRSRRAADLAALARRARLVAKLAPVFETVDRAEDASCPRDVALIGFCGAPWTVASYMIAGRGTPDQAPARLLRLSPAGAVRRADRRLVDALGRLSRAAIARRRGSGADLRIPGRACCRRPNSSAGASRRSPHRRQSCARTCLHAPIIAFPRGAATQLGKFAGIDGLAAIGLDTAVDPRVAAVGACPARFALQGNLDPLALIAGGRGARRGSRPRAAGFRRPRAYLQSRPRHPARNADRPCRAPRRARARRRLSVERAIATCDTLEDRQLRRPDLVRGAAVRADRGDGGARGANSPARPKRRPPGRFVDRAMGAAIDATGAPGGGGRMAMLRGRLFEKMGAHVSTVYGDLRAGIRPADSRRRRRTRASGRPASRSSPIPGTRNVPTAHMNTRFVVTTKAWFGGGADLTPMLDARRRADDPDAFDVSRGDAGRLRRAMRNVAVARAVQGVVRRIFLPHPSQRAARDRRDILTIISTAPATPAIGVRRRLRVQPRRRRDLSFAIYSARSCGATSRAGLERGRARGTTRPARPLRRIQPALRPRHDFRPEDRRQRFRDPLLDAAAGALALMASRRPPISAGPPSATRTRKHDRRLAIGYAFESAAR